MRFGPSWNRVVNGVQRASRSRNRAIAGAMFAVSIYAVPGGPEALGLKPESPQEQVARSNLEGIGLQQERAAKGINAVPGRTPPNANRQSRREARRRGPAGSRPTPRRTRGQKAKARRSRKIAGASRRANRPQRGRRHTGEPVRNARMKRRISRTMARRRQASQQRPVNRVAGRSAFRQAAGTPRRTPGVSK